MKEYKKLWRYGILRRLKRGVTISIMPTFVCNYNCDYCSMRLPNGHRKISKEVALSDWLHMVDNFPYRLREVIISGGEPTLVSYFTDLVDRLLARGLMVTVFTNLSNDILLKNIPHPRLRIVASYHKQVSADRFMVRWEAIKKRGYQITVEEIGEKRLPIRTDVKKELTTGDELKVYTMLRFAPDMSAHTSCFSLFD